MPDAVLLDTSALPVWRGLDGPLWLSVRKLCEVSDIAVYLPELVIHESVNLRIERFAEAAAEFVDAYNRIEKFFDVDPIYVPDVEEVSHTWEGELRAAFRVLDLDGADAVDALRREARRTRPARRGRGGRDSAIWMTTLRLAATHDNVYFVSSNTADFAAGKGGKLHPALAAEAAESSARVSYVTSIHGLIERLAAEVGSPVLESASVAQVLNSELRERVLGASAGDERYRDIAAADLTLEGVRIVDVRAKKAYAIGERNLALVMGSGALTIGQPDDQRSVDFTFTAWLEFGSGDASILTGEVEAVALS